MKLPCRCMPIVAQLYHSPRTGRVSSASANEGKRRLRPGRRARGPGARRTHARMSQGVGVGRTIVTLGISDVVPNATEPITASNTSAMKPAPPMIPIHENSRA